MGVIAMQYRFALPADYDMGVVDRRVAERAPLLDGFPGMRLKAYLTRRAPGASENQYAPFYVWDDVESMNAFLCGPPFAGVSRAFGWPAVRLWPVWRSITGPGAARAAFATQEVVPVAPHTALDRLRAAEMEAVERAVGQEGALAATAGFDPTGWTRVRFRLWAERPEVGVGVEAFEVGYVSVGRAG